MTASLAKCRLEFRKGNQFLFGKLLKRSNHSEPLQEATERRKFVSVRKESPINHSRLPLEVK